MIFLSESGVLNVNSMWSHLKAWVKLFEHSGIGGRGVCHWSGCTHRGRGFAERNDIPAWEWD